MGLIVPIVIIEPKLAEGDSRKRYLCVIMSSHYQGKLYFSLKITSYKAKL